MHIMKQFKRFREAHEDHEDIRATGIHNVPKIQNVVQNFINWWPETIKQKDNQLHINQETIGHFREAKSVAPTGKWMPDCLAHSLSIIITKHMG